MSEANPLVPRSFTSRRPRQRGAHRLYAILRMAIKLGELDVRSPLDERRLCNELQFSRSEVREVLRLLSDEGLLSRKVSVGTYVAAEPVTVDLFDFVPIDPRVRLTRRQTDTFVLQGGGLVASKFDDETRQVVLTEHLLMMDGELMAINTAFSAVETEPSAVVDTAVERQLHLGVQFPSEYGAQYGGMEVSLDARIADPHIAAVLEVPVGAPILLREQVISDAEGTIWEYSLSQWRADRVIFSSRRSTGAEFERSRREST
jgi:GntR family transcriptional regulator